MNSNYTRNIVARGWILLAVFQVHGLLYFFLVNPPETLDFGAFQVKVLSPQVAIFFILSGMSSSRIGDRSVRSVAISSLMLVFLAILSHSVGMVLNQLLFHSADSVWVFVKSLMRPIIFGTGYSTFVAWFFVVLAVARVLVYIFERSRLLFAGITIGVVGLIYLSKFLHLPDNIYEWRNWPVAFLFFLLGTHIPKDWRVKPLFGALALVAAIVLTWFNSPDILNDGLCWTCHVTFVAQPMVGQYGFLPILLLHELLFFVFVLWISQASRPRLLVGGVSFIGQASLQLLLLHGWLMITFYSLVLYVLPPGNNPWIGWVLMPIMPFLHVGVYLLFKGPLDRFVAICFDLSKAIVERVTQLKEQWDARRSLPVPADSQGAGSPSPKE